jgi:hypothetical protein
VQFLSLSESLPGHCCFAAYYTLPFSCPWQLHLLPLMTGTFSVYCFCKSYLLTPPGLAFCLRTFLLKI